MIDAKQLLVDLTRQLKGLEADLRQRIAEQPDLDSNLREEWKAALDAKRCAETFETWADQVITQAGVHWLLSCVFLRFIEDNQLVDRPWLAGTPDSGRLALARDRHEAYFRAHPLESDRDYLLAAFREAGTLPGLRTFFDEAHNPVFRLGISGDAAMALRQFWQQVNTDTGLLLRDFTDPAWNTRFLGDLYQDLSEATRKRYALLQTPEFVEEFILDRTLTPAIRTFGFRETRMIDPTCGSGHFLLGGFARLVDAWQRNEPSRNARDIAQKALDAVAGVDLNPFAVAISRFRLLVAALRVADVQRLAAAPDFRIHVAIGDSLLHGTRFGLTNTQSLLDGDQYSGTGLAHSYATEDLAAVKQILGQQYQVVVGNPPYIVVRDSSLSKAYRSRYLSCHRQFSLGVPFTERFFDLAVAARDGKDAGWVGLITANSFMKREFGSHLIEKFLPRIDLTHVIDTSKAYLPGHGTPTVILFGRNQSPVQDVVRLAMGGKGEPSAPRPASSGKVWQALLSQLDQVNSESEYLSVVDAPRRQLAIHPWSIGGGGTSEVLEIINGQPQKRRRMAGVCEMPIGRAVRIAQEDLFIFEVSRRAKSAAPDAEFRWLVIGEDVRDWTSTPQALVWYPYAESAPNSTMLRRLWPWRITLANRSTFQGVMEDAGLRWFDYMQHTASAYQSPLSINFAFVATHNHFVLDRGGRVFNRSAPVIKLPAGASLAKHFEILGVLNTSIACFWMKQVFYPKGGDQVGDEGARVSVTPWEDRYEFTGTGLAEFPIPDASFGPLASKMDSLALAWAESSPAAIVRSGKMDRASLDAARHTRETLFRQLIVLQEELDWSAYYAYGLIGQNLTHASPPEIELGERAFEIVLARNQDVEDHSEWFSRHGSTPLTEIPSQWPSTYKTLIERRIEAIEKSPHVGLVERPEFKRRWNAPLWDDLEKAALRGWLLDRLEQPAFWPAHGSAPPQLTSTSKLAERAQTDADFMQVAALYAGHADFNPAQIVAELVASEAVPLLPAQRYSEDGLRKRAQWQDTWVLQRCEDAVDAEIDRLEDSRRQELMTIVAKDAQDGQPDADALAWVRQELDKAFIPLRKERKAREIGPIPVPPKYKSSDFLKVDFWRLRGGLDVPKERFVSFPGVERGADGSLVIAWAGWNHLQLATALAGYYGEMKDNEGWEPARLQPLLAGLLELVPWLEQWHNDIDPEFGQRMGTYYRGFVTEDARALGFTLDDLRNWRPAVTPARRGRRPRVAT